MGQTGTTSQRGQAGQTDLTFKLDFLETCVGQLSQFLLCFIYWVGKSMQIKFIILFNN